MRARTRLQLQHEPYSRHLLNMVIGIEDSFGTGNVIVSVVEPMTLRKVEENDARPIEPTLTLHTDDAQQWMDELWRVGIRPTEGAGSVGQLAATQKHLEDMRSVAFNRLGITPP